MALTKLVTEALVPLLKPGQTIASFGYPDLVAPEADVARWLGKREIDYRDDSEQICKWHGLKPQRIPDAKSFFAAFGCELTVFDIYKARGDEVIWDLNEPDMWMHYPEYNFALDVGTLEHCFNVGQAIRNMAEILKVGGTIFHGNPFLMGNHGFYGLNPTFYADFYGQPGFELLWCKMMVKGGTEPVDVPLTKRFRFEGAETNIFAAARRIEAAPVNWPQQTKYKNLMEAK